MTAPIDDLRDSAGADERLLRRLDGLTDEQVAAPSALPGWNRAQLLTHVARNADSFRGMAEAAMRDETAVQYPGGAEQRERDIEAGRLRSAVEVVADVVRSVEWLHETWAAVPDGTWDHPGQTVSRQVRLWETVAARFREVEVHHVDLDLGYAPADWPERFVRVALPHRVTSLPGRAVDDWAGRFVIWADDLEVAWVVTPGAAAPFSAGDDAPDAIVRGPGAQLLAWLYGRDHEPLTVTGDDELVAPVPQRFPFG